MDINEVLDDAIGAETLEVPFRGHLLLERPLFNKGTAFTMAERRAFGLLGLLPPTEETLDEQVARSYEAFGPKDTDLERHIYLRQLQDANETLFYRFLLDHLAEMMPVVYTPTVGLACERFSHIYRRPRGLFISYAERDDIDAILENAASPRVEVIVVTDGERILGLGDQGAGGMGIPIGKLSLYTACGGIHPATTLPILLDVGTNNEERLRDPLYVGWRHERISGADYEAFVDAFVQAVKRKFPRVLLQWEDFAQPHAGPLLDRYRDQLCTFNDDIQGTAAVTTGTLLAAVAAAGGRLRDQRVAILGAGSAGCGVAEQLVAAMVEEGLTEAEARARLFLIDRPGLLHDGLEGLRTFQRKLAQPQHRVAGWRPAEGQPIGLLDVVTNAHPTILIGTSGQPSTFTEEIVRAMMTHVERPIIFPLSNPTSRAEATPADLIAWTDGRALIATGSPFGDVTHNGRRFPIAQCNNSYIFPGLGLGILASGAQRVSDAMFMAAARALAGYTAARRDPAAPLLPPLAESRRVARAIALAVATAAQREGLAERRPDEESERLIDAKMWEPRLPADEAEAGLTERSRRGDPSMTQPERAQTGAQLLVRSLEAQGVPFVFGIPGGAISPILDALADRAPRFITVRHETAGAFMAQAYGRCTGKPGVVLTTSGPGLINAVCGVATAQADRDPIVAITGQVPRAMRFKSYHMNIDTVGLFAPITKWSVGIEEPGTIPEVLANAFRIAARPRPGAVHVSVPSDVSRAATDAQPLAASDLAPGGLPPDEALARAAALLQSARRPVLLLGVAAGEAAATAAIRRLLRKTSLPVACTFEGNGVVPRDLLDHFVGRVGYAHNQPADRLLQQADVVACIGYDLIEYDPTEWLGSATAVIHLDEVPATIDRAYRPSVELVGDLGRTIDALTERLGQVAADDSALIREARYHLLDEQSRGASRGGCPVHPLRILHDLGQVVGDDVTVTCDVGAHQIWTARYFFRFAPRRLFFSMGHQTMGVGLPWAIGAALARPGESAVSISGDGSFLMTCMELETAVRLKLPTVHLVWRDGSYNLVGLLALREYGREVGTHFGPTDFVTLAQSFGAAGFRVNDAEEFRPTLERALALRSPAVIEIPVDYRENLPLVQPMRLRAVD